MGNADVIKINEFRNIDPYTEFVRRAETEKDIEACVRILIRDHVCEHIEVFGMTLGEFCEVGCDDEVEREAMCEMVETAVQKASAEIMQRFNVMKR